MDNSQSTHKDQLMTFINPLDPFGLMTSRAPTIDEEMREIAAQEAAAVARKLPAETRYVTMSDALLRAGQGLTLSEKRLVCLAVSKLNSYRYYSSQDNLVSKISAVEYAEEFDVSVDTAYNQLVSAEKSLYSRSITYFEAAHKKTKREDLPPTRVKMRWIITAKYQAHEGFIELTWHPRIVPELTHLRQKFTRYKLRQASSLRSIYSWRLLELLLRFEANGWAEYTIEDFCQSLDVTAKTQKNFGKVRSQVIEPALKELREKDGWIIEPEYKKAGRRVKAVRFVFQQDPQGKLNLAA